MIKRMAVAALAAVAVAAAPAAPADAGTGAGDADRVTVVGEGRAPVVPDVLRVRAGVEVRRPQAPAAYRAAATAAANLVRRIVASGVAERYVQTADLSVQPEYSEDRPGGRRTIVGYRAAEDVNATVRDLPRADRTLNAIMNAGDDVRLHGATFDKEDWSAEQAVAERRAFADARRRAERYARLLGRRLGRVLSVSAQSVDPIPPHIYPREAIAAAGGHLSPGQGQSRVTVNVVYALR